MNIPVMGPVHHKLARRYMEIDFQQMGTPVRRVALRFAVNRQRTKQRGHQACLIRVTQIIEQQLRLGRCIQSMACCTIIRQVPEQPVANTMVWDTIDQFLDVFDIRGRAVLLADLEAIDACPRAPAKPAPLHFSPT